MKILVLNGSPKTSSSTTLTMTNAFIQGMASPGESKDVSYISSYDKHVKYCQGDLSCWFRQDGHCIIQDDDLNDILDAMKESDILIWSFPLHCHGIPASLKAILDRTIAFLKINMADRTTYIEHERTFDLSAKKNVFIIGGGYPYYPENFAAVKKLLQIYFKHPSTLCICETALLEASDPNIEPLKQKLLANLQTAGREYSEQGHISAETLHQVESPLLPNDAYIKIINSTLPPVNH